MAEIKISTKYQNIKDERDVYFWCASMLLLSIGVSLYVDTGTYNQLNFEVIFNMALNLMGIGVIFAIGWFAPIRYVYWLTIFSMIISYGYSFSLLFKYLNI